MSLIRNIGFVNRQTDADKILSAIADSGGGLVPPNGSNSFTPLIQPPAPAPDPVLMSTNNTAPWVIGLGLAAAVYFLAKKKNR